MNEEQLDIIYGNLLGNGSIPREGKRNCRFNYSKTEDKIEYLKFLHEKYQPYTKDKKINKLQHKHGIIYMFKTKSDIIFTELRKNWYTDEKKANKKLPDDFKLNWRIIAFWFADRGTNSKKTLYLGTQSFSLKDAEYLRDQLKDLGIETTINFHSGHVIRIAANCYYMFLDNVRPYISSISCLDYKHDTTEADKVGEIKIFEKKEILEAVSLGQPIKQVAEDFGCHPKTIYRWTKE